ncbi:Tlg2-vesicle protein [Parahypoxylon ruwenzoriense]
MPGDNSFEGQVPKLSASPSFSSPLPSPSPSPSPNPTSSARTEDDVPVPPWVRQSPQRSSSGTNTRRLSTPYSRSAANDDARAPLARRIIRSSTSLMNKTTKLFYSLTLTQRILAVFATVVINVLLILFLVYSHRIFAALEPVAEGWRALPGGWVLVFLMTCASAFPPMIGYSTCVTVAGFVYGFPGGWPIVASATVAGSTASFLASRTIFSKYVHALVGADKRFVALGQVLRRDGLLVLAAIRFCPLPYSLSNGFLATIPSITPLRFALATTLATPKLFVHVFIGSRLALLAESGDEMSVGDKTVNYLSMLFFSAIGMTLGLFIYRRTMARAKELAGEEATGAGGEFALNEDETGLMSSFGDLEEGVLGDSGRRRGEADEAALMDDDDISLWEADGVHDAFAYRDEEEAVGGTVNGSKGDQM